MDSAISDTPSAAPSSRTRFEVIFASVWLGVGLFLLPAAIYLVGTLMLGPYKPGAGLIQFYGDFFADLASFSLRAWIIAIGPLIIITVVRLLFVGLPPRPSAAESEPPPVDEPPPREMPKARTRVEPRISSE
jgi:hypothetical protein